MIATLPSPIAQPPVHEKGLDLYRGSIIQPNSLWSTSTNSHIKQNAPALFRLVQVIESDSRHSGLTADQASVEKLRRAFEAVAETFEQPFHTICHQYYTAPTKDKGSVQNKVLDTLCNLSAQFPEIPGILWCVLGHIGTRQDPFAELSLLDDNSYAFGSAALNDASLHAMCMVTRLKSLVDDHLIHSVKAVVIHGHNCDCCIEAVDRPADFKIRLRARCELEKMFEAFMAQLLSEIIKTCGYDLPHVASPRYA